MPGYAHAHPAARKRRRLPIEIQMIPLNVTFSGDSDFDISAVNLHMKPAMRYYTFCLLSHLILTSESAGAASCRRSSLIWTDSAKDEADVLTCLPQKLILLKPGGEAN